MAGLLRNFSDDVRHATYLGLSYSSWFKAKNLMEAAAEFCDFVRGPQSHTFVLLPIQRNLNFSFLHDEKHLSIIKDYRLGASGIDW